MRINNSYNNPNFKGTAYLSTSNVKGFEKFFADCQRFSRNLSDQSKMSIKEESKKTRLKAVFAMTCPDKLNNLLRLEAGNFSIQNGLGFRFVSKAQSQ